MSCDRQHFTEKFMLTIFTACRNQWYGWCSSRFQLVFGTRGGNIICGVMGQICCRIFLFLVEGIGREYDCTT